MHHVLGHDDRRIDQHADRDGDARQRHGVGLDVDDAQPAAAAAMIRNDESAASGSVIATMNDVRTCSKTTSTHRLAEIIASTTVPVTVPIAPSISGVRS